MSEPQVTIGLNSNGSNRNILRVGVGNELIISADLTDAQLLSLVTQGVAILGNRNWSQRCDIAGAKADIIKMLDEVVV